MNAIKSLLSLGGGGNAAVTPEAGQNAGKVPRPSAMPPKDPTRMSTMPEPPTNPVPENTVPKNAPGNAVEVTKSDASLVPSNSGSLVDKGQTPRRSSSGATVKIKEDPDRYELDEDYVPGQLYSDKGRPHWEDKYNCILSMVGFAVGLSNIYRFPYLCFAHGGLAFLIVYCFFLIVVAVPLLYLEVLIGQFVQAGMIKFWTRLIPILRGVGWVQSILPLMVAFHNNVFLTWSLHYCFMSFVNARLPWIGCQNPWNTKTCRDIPPDFEHVDVKKNELRAGSEYFRGRVQRRWKSVYNKDFAEKQIEWNGKNGTFGLGYTDTEGLGYPDWELAIYLLIIHLVFYVFIRRGLRFSGKGIWFTVCSPYFALFVLIYRGIAIPGGLKGLKYFITFEAEGAVNHLWSMETWVAAADQMFTSLSLGGGIHLTLASYNKFSNKIHRDAIAVIVMDTLTSIFCAIIVFLALGSIAESDSSSMEDLFAQGPDLIFEVCCDALGRLPGSDFFTFLFFLMVLLLGFETAVVSLTAGKAALFETYGGVFSNKKFQNITIHVVLAISYIVGLLCISRGGLHIFILLDKFTAVIPFHVCSLLMVVGVTWFWGLHELCDAAETMTGKRPSFYYQISWKFIAPIVLFVTLILSFTTNESAAYRDRGSTSKFRKELQIFGMVYAHLPNILIFIGIALFWRYTPAKNWKQKLLLGIAPNYAHPKIYRTGSDCRARASHYLYCVDCPKMVRRLTRVFPSGTGRLVESGTTAGQASGLGLQPKEMEKLLKIAATSRDSLEKKQNKDEAGK